MNMARLPGTIGLSAALAVFFCISGCTEGPDTDEATSYFDRNPSEFTHEVVTPWEQNSLELSIKGDNSILDTDGQVASFSASGGTPPYKWEVHDVFLGTIIQSDGAVAVYQRNAVGDNVVILTDHEGNSAYFAISQP